MIAPVIHRFDSLTSTNDVARDMADRGEPAGTVVVARSQTAGRGRRGRTWLDESGKSLTMSVILRPQLPAGRLGELAFVASMAVADYLASDYAVIPQLKWPNDVLVRDKKIAGILIEAAPSAAICGIGLNVNQSSFAAEIRAIATSLRLETGSTYDVATIAEPLASSLMEVSEAHLASGFEEILARWRKYMWGIGKQATVETVDGPVRGVIADVDSYGALLLRDDAGRIHSAHAGELVTIGP